MEKLAPALKLLAASLVAHAFPGAHLPPTHPYSMRADRAAIVVAEEVPRVFPEHDEKTQEAEGRAALVWNRYEANFEENPMPSVKGANDDGHACGPMQVHPEYYPAGALEGITCKEMRTDFRLGMRAGLLAIRYFEDKCGSLAAALTAYSMRGVCPKGWTLGLVEKRCTEAGLTKKCEMP